MLWAGTVNPARRRNGSANLGLSSVLFVDSSFNAIDMTIGFVQRCQQAGYGLFQGIDHPFDITLIQQRMHPLPEVGIESVQSYALLLNVPSFLFGYLFHDSFPATSCSENSQSCPEFQITISYQVSSLPPQIRYLRLPPRCTMGKYPGDRGCRRFYKFFPPSR